MQTHTNTIPVNGDGIGILANIVIVIIVIGHSAAGGDGWTGQCRRAIGRDWCINTAITQHQWHLAGDYSNARQEVMTSALNRFD